MIQALQTLFQWAGDIPPLPPRGPLGWEALTPGAEAANLKISIALCLPRPQCLLGTTGTTNPRAEEVATLLAKCVSLSNAFSDMTTKPFPTDKGELDIKNNEKTGVCYCTPVSFGCRQHLQGGKGWGYESALGRILRSLFRMVPWETMVGSLGPILAYRPFGGFSCVCVGEVGRMPSQCCQLLILLGHLCVQIIHTCHLCKNDF